jgi:hypothetical protein
MCTHGTTGSGPRVEAAVPLSGDESVKVYGQAARRWGHNHVLTSGKMMSGTRTLHGSRRAAFADSPV